MHDIGRHPWKRSQASCSSTGSCSMLLRTVNSQLLNTAKVSITPLGSMFQRSTTLVGKKVFLAYLHGFCVLIWAPLLLVLSLGSTEKNLAVPSLVPFNNIPRAFSAADWTLPSQPLPKCWHSNPLINTALCCTHSNEFTSLWYCRSQHQTQPSDVTHLCSAAGKAHLPQAAGDALPYAAQDVVGCLCHKSILLLYHHLVPLDPQVPFRKAAGQLPACGGAGGHSCPDAGCCRVPWTRSFLWSGEVPLNCSKPICSVKRFSQFSLDFHLLNFEAKAKAKAQTGGMFC